jgi:hypothetical protein
LFGSFGCAGSRADKIFKSSKPPLDDESGLEVNIEN